MKKVIKWIKENICYLIGTYILLGLSFNRFRRDFNFYEYVGILIGIVLMFLLQFNKKELENRIEETKYDFQRYQDITTNLLTQTSATNNFNKQNIIYNMPYKTKIDIKDLNIKLIILRRDLEINFKTYLYRQMGHEINLNKPMSLMTMVRLYIGKTNRDLYKPFSNVISVCIAAMHDENVDKVIVNYVIDIGLSLIKQIQKDGL